MIVIFLSLFIINCNSYFKIIQKGLSSYVINPVEKELRTIEGKYYIVFPPDGENWHYCKDDYFAVFFKNYDEQNHSLHLVIKTYIMDCDIGSKEEFIRYQTNRINGYNKEKYSWINEEYVNLEKYGEFSINYKLHAIEKDYKKVNYGEKFHINENRIIFINLKHPKICYEISCIEYYKKYAKDINSDIIFENFLNKITIK